MAYKEQKQCACRDAAKCYKPTKYLCTYLIARGKAAILLDINEMANQMAPGIHVFAQNLKYGCHVSSKNLRIESCSFLPEEERHQYLSNGRH